MGFEPWTLWLSWDLWLFLRPVKLKVKIGRSTFWTNHVGKLARENLTGKWNELMWRKQFPKSCSRDSQRMGHTWRLRAGRRFGEFWDDQFSSKVWLKIHVGSCQDWDQKWISNAVEHAKGCLVWARRCVSSIFGVSLHGRQAPEVHVNFQWRVEMMGKR